MIHTQNLSKSYRSGNQKREALHDINIDISKGEIIAITGPSGSGKSTLLHILGCLDMPTTGKYLLDGEDISKLSPPELAWIRNHKIGFIFQDFDLLEHLTALENVRLPMIYGGISSKESMQKSEYLLEQMGLASRRHLYPAQLSGGQQQRTAIARALSMNPQLILADEPTGNLDSQNSKLIVNILKAMNRDSNVTVVLVTHALEIAQETGRIIELHDGKTI